MRSKGSGLTCHQEVLLYGRAVYYVDNVASNLRVTPRMFGRLHRSMA
jgi:hypothetical protein